MEGRSSIGLLWQIIADSAKTGAIMGSRFLVDLVHFSLRAAGPRDKVH